MLKLISDSYKVYYKSKVDPNRLVGNKTSTIFPFNTELIAIGFGSLLNNEPFPRELIEKLLTKGLGVIYFSDGLPENPLLHENLVYIESTWAWYTHTCLLDIQKVAYIFSSSEKSDDIIEKFISLTPNRLCKKITLDSCEELEDSSYTQCKDLDNKTLLIDLESFAGGRGLGDTILATVPIRHLAQQGWVIDVYCRETAYNLLKNNPFIRGVYFSKNNANLYTEGEQFGLPNPRNYSWHFILDHGLEDYKLVRNLQDRMDSLCELLHINPKDIKDFTPVLTLTKEEDDFGKVFKSKLDNKPLLVLGLLAANSITRSYPRDHWIPLFEILCSKYNVVFTHDYKTTIDFVHPNFFNLSGTCSFMDWCSLIKQADLTFSMDSCLYWVALAMNTPCIVYFTSIAANLRVSHYPQVEVLDPPLPCKPCYDRQMVKVAELWSKCKKVCDLGFPPDCCNLVKPIDINRVIVEFSINRGIVSK